jgi:tetratricopeptide (TPR) repeat protein
LKKAFAAEPKNHETTDAIGEACRVESQDGDPGYRELAEEAMEWFGRTMKLDRWDDSSYSRYGWCLDWLGRKGESGPYFNKAMELDPNGYYTVAGLGLHYVETGDYAAAKRCFERSMRLQWPANPIAYTYLQITDNKLREAATNQISARLDASAP